jgi:hypothetical protein
MPRLLEVLIVVLILLWALGAFVVHIGGDFIHLMLVIVLIVVVVRLVTGSGKV